jgi:tetratricopeptide (TPR) repeat protein
LSIGHYGLLLDSYTALGVALTQQGQEKEALEAFDQAIALAMTVGELLPQHLARIRRAELLHFSVGESDSAFAEAVRAQELWSRSPEDLHRIEPLALMAIIEARNGRRDRAERSFCEASLMLEPQPADQLMLERTLLAMAAALLLESRHDLNGMKARYAEAGVLATGTDSPGYWAAAVSLQHAESLLRLRRPREAKVQLEEASGRFALLGNAVQSARAQRALRESESGPALD